MSEKRIDVTKDDMETVKSVGRALAWLKRKDKTLYETLLRKAREEGVKASDLLYEALRWKYIDSELSLDQISARDFLNLMERWNEMQTNFMRNWLDMLRIFWVEGINKWNEVISAVSEQIEAEKKQEKPKASPEMVINLISALPSMIMNMMTNLPQMIQSMSEFIRVGQTSQPAIKIEQTTPTTT
jgi:RNA processing factor Prp31